MGEGLINETGRCVGVAGTVQDSTEQTRAIQQINRLSHFDVLTELPNRSRFHEKLEETLEAARRDGRRSRSCSSTSTTSSASTTHSATPWATTCCASSRSA